MKTRFGKCYELGKLGSWLVSQTSQLPQGRTSIIVPVLFPNRPKDVIITRRYFGPDLIKIFQRRSTLDFFATTKIL